jgi:hypothetical protein
MIRGLLGNCALAQHHDEHDKREATFHPVLLLAGFYLKTAASRSGSRSGSTRSARARVDINSGSE